REICAYTAWKDTPETRREEARKQITAVALVLTRPNPVPPAIVGRRTRAIAVTSRRDPTSSEGYGPYHRCEVSVVAPWIFLDGVSYIPRPSASRSAVPECRNHGWVSVHLRTPFPAPDFLIRPVCLFAGCSG